MKTRRESREQAFVLLFEKTMTNDNMEDIIEMAVEARGIEMDAYCKKLTSLAELHLDEIDALSSRISAAGACAAFPR